MYNKRAGDTVELLQYDSYYTWFHLLKTTPFLLSSILFRVVWFLRARYYSFLMKHTYAGAPVPAVWFTTLGCWLLATVNKPLPFVLTVLLKLVRGLVSSPARLLVSTNSSCCVSHEFSRPSSLLSGYNRNVRPGKLSGATVDIVCKDLKLLYPLRTTTSSADTLRLSRRVVLDVQLWCVVAWSLVVKSCLASLFVVTSITNN